jgi:hypothetical protein
MAHDKPMYVHVVRQRPEFGSPRTPSVLGQDSSLGSPGLIVADRLGPPGRGPSLGPDGFHSPVETGNARNVRLPSDRGPSLVLGGHGGEDDPDVGVGITWSIHIPEIASVPQVSAASSASGSSGRAEVVVPLQGRGGLELAGGGERGALPAGSSSRARPIAEHARDDADGFARPLVLGGNLEDSTGDALGEGISFPQGSSRGEGGGEEESWEPAGPAQALQLHLRPRLGGSGGAEHNRVAALRAGGGFGGGGGDGLGDSAEWSQSFDVAAGGGGGGLAAQARLEAEAQVRRQLGLPPPAGSSMGSGGGGGGGAAARYSSLNVGPVVFRGGARRRRAGLDAELVLEGSMNLGGSSGKGGGIGGALLDIEARFNDDGTEQDSTEILQLGLPPARCVRPPPPPPPLARLLVLGGV